MSSLQERLRHQLRVLNLKISKVTYIRLMALFLIWASMITLPQLIQDVHIPSSKHTQMQPWQQVMLYQTQVSSWVLLETYSMLSLLSKQVLLCTQQFIWMPKLRGEQWITMLGSTSWRIVLERIWKLILQVSSWNLSFVETKLYPYRQLEHHHNHMLF